MGTLLIALTPAGTENGPANQFLGGYILRFAHMVVEEALSAAKWIEETCITLDNWEAVPILPG